jgi:hypothetical protein
MATTSRSVATWSRATPAWRSPLVLIRRARARSARTSPWCCTTTQAAALARRPPPAHCNTAHPPQTLLRTRLPKQPIGAHSLAPPCNFSLLLHLRKQFTVRRDLPSRGALASNPLWVLRINWRSDGVLGPCLPLSDKWKYPRPYFESFSRRPRPSLFSKTPFPGKLLPFPFRLSLRAVTPSAPLPSYLLRITTDSFMRSPPFLLTMKPTGAVSVWLVFHEDCWLLLSLGRFCLTFSGRVFLSISREPSNAAQRFRRLRSGTCHAPQSRARL